MPNTSVTTYALPSDIHLGNGGTLSDEAARTRRVQQQIQMRMAEKSTLPRQNGSSTQYAMSDYGGSSTMKYNTFNPNFSSKSSYMYSGSKTMGPRVSQRQDFSCRSAAPDLAQFQRMSVGGGGSSGGGGGGGGGGGFYQEEVVRMGGYQGSMRHPNRVDHDAMSLHSLRNVPQANPWMIDNSDAGSLVSDRDATFGRQYTQSAVNGFGGQIRQGGGAMMTQQSMRRSQSGTLTRSSGMMGGGGGGGGGGGEVIHQQQSFKGPAFRTISRITNRNRSSFNSMSGNQMTSSASNMGGGGDMVDRGGFMVSTLSGSQGNLLMQRQGTMNRSMSIKSMQSVGKGMDIYGGQMEMGTSFGNLGSLSMAQAVEYLGEDDLEMQVMGSAFIQHQCYNENSAKDEVRHLNGIGALVKLFNSKNPEVRRYATGATRNLIFENQENKLTLIKEDGIAELVRALDEPDDELHKNITGILWNLSSKEKLKTELADKTVKKLTETILIPVSTKELDDAERMNEGSDRLSVAPSQAEIFCNTTGCLRNVSSADPKTRKLMRETKGLLDSLVNYIKAATDKNNTEEKGVENAMCILRNLSYQLYTELPPSMFPDGNENYQTKSDSMSPGCFSYRSRKARDRKQAAKFKFSEITNNPKGPELLFHPSTLGVYHKVLKSCEINVTTRESATGALQNITAGESKSASMLANWAIENERIVPTLIDLMRTEREMELRSLTGLLRNLSRHADNKDNLATKLVPSVVEKLPEADEMKDNQCDVVVNLCGILNNLVMASQKAARDICYFNGIKKLFDIKKSESSIDKLKASKSASTVLLNMYNYKKLHKDYAKGGWEKKHFTDSA